MNTKQRMVIMTPLLAAAAWLAFFGDKTPSGGVAEPVARVPTRMVSKAIDSDIASTAAPAAMTETDTTEQAGAILRLASREPLKAELALTNPTDIFSVGGGPTPVVKPQENVPPPP
ncbi:MAG TPA: hypothetical protein VFW00_00500, partial [Rhodocyclaceae bacterium]|nr:hypothetical protein [Rhodocyclaceae bacterium]